MAYAGNFEINVKMNGKNEKQNVLVGHVCSASYDLPDIEDINCENLISKISARKRFLGSVLLHEYTHFDLIGKAAVGEHITDAKNAKGEFIGWGPQDSRKLTDAEKLINAENYTWLAFAHYWSMKCNVMIDFGG